MINDEGEVAKACEEDIALAHNAASSSSSIIAYRDSASDRNREPAWMRDQVSPVCCCRTNPIPCRLVSVHRRVGLVGSKYASVGADTNDSFMAWKASSDQTNSFLG